MLICGQGTLRVELQVQVQVPLHLRAPMSYFFQLVGFNTPSLQFLVFCTIFLPLSAEAQLGAGSNA